MPFSIPESLLRQLRARRDLGRQAHGERTTASKPPSPTQQNFIDSLRHLFSGDRPPSAVAEAYLRSMDGWKEEIEAKHDAFLLDPGMGPMVYLAADGRVLSDSRGWDGDTVVELLGDAANAAIVVGAEKTGLVDLLGLLPPMPPGGTECPKCHGKRTAEPVEGFGRELPCTTCGSRGWLGAMMRP